jgi:4-amino-4-deoxy-L-arabinose transferase-like glycosyltransferase
VKPGVVALLFCAIFVLIGAAWIDKPGIQTDEALFAEAIYPPFDKQFMVRILGRDHQLMVMSYVGALKPRLWALIFRVWAPSAASVRIPALLLGALSIWWVYRLLSLTLGSRAALAGAALLATDPIYLLYSRIDHGPVVILHLCLSGAMLALVRFHLERRLAWLAAGFFALGLGMWEKAIFAWLVSGLAIAAAVVFWEYVCRAISFRNLAVATTAFTIGASPLIVYNVRHKLATFRGNTVWSSEHFSGKAMLLGRVLEGEALFGSMFREVWDGPLNEPSTAAQKAAVGIALSAGLPRRTLMGYLGMASLLLLPFIWRTPAGAAGRFALIAAAVAWFQMAFIKGAGGGAHHTILLWPLPTIGIAALMAAASEKAPRGRALLSAVVAVACVANALVLSTYYTNLLRNGGTSSWTDAMYPSFEAIRRMESGTVCTIDWGFLDTLRLLERGRIGLCAASDPVDDEARRIALFQITQPRYAFLTHTDGNESFPGITARFVQFAESRGFRRINRQVFADSNGRQTVEIFQFAPR